MSRREDYTRAKMRAAPVDDDIIFMLFGLLIADDHGLEFATEAGGASWIKYLPYACTAEALALDNLKKIFPPACPAREIIHTANGSARISGPTLGDTWRRASPNGPRKWYIMA